MRSVQPGDLFKEIHSPGFFIPPPTIWHQDRIAPDDFAAMHVSWRKVWFDPQSVRILVLEDVYVASEGLVFTRDLDVFAPSVTQHTQEHIDESRDAIRRAAGKLPRIAGDAVLCRKRGAANYGHWLVEMLPKAWLVTQHWDRPLCFLIQATAEPLRSAMRASLAHLGIHSGHCHESGEDPVLVDRVILVDGLTDHGGYMSPLAMECLRDVGAKVQPGRAERLLVTRSSMQTRRFVNEASLLAEAEAKGLTVVDPSRLPFGEQVSAFKGAKQIVGAMGSAMANVAFAQAGTPIVTLAPATMRDTFFWFICGLHDLPYVEVRCLQFGPKTGPAEWDTEILLSSKDLEDVFGLQKGLLTSTKVRTASKLHFNPESYVEKYADIKAAGVDPLSHFIEFGWREGRLGTPAQAPFVVTPGETVNHFLRRILISAAGGEDSDTDCNEQVLHLLRLCR